VVTDSSLRVWFIYWNYLVQWGC